MDTRSRAREDEKSIVLTDWIESLDTLGINTEKVLKEEHASLKHQQTIHAHYTRFRSDHSRGVNASASRLADAPNDYDTFASTLATAAAATDQSVLDRAQQIAALAGEFASQKAFSHFRRRGEGLYDIIRGVFEETRDSIIRDGGNLPDGVVDLDSAARAGVESEWLRLEALTERWSDILHLIESWYINGALPADDRDLERYNVWMFVFENYSEAVNTYGAGILSTIRQVINGDAKLLTIDQVDALGSNTVKKRDPNEQRAANHRQQQADDEANAILRAEWEANGVSERLGKRALKRGSNA
ncbi:hypothetical protein [Curtobacterium sp. MCPF17_046]|uniref:hypothetical protein n=1 Tax=Curtobacterium sp. MCPF17_046 TaxID=2175663 RepID=UPI000D89322C|nr:hypothetical protein [Curtobacterium sp. MCPF17_046]PYY38847.1 hypothetical protein DEJ32_10430 [Curtobacterium sp. MCPF17_046]